MRAKFQEQLEFLNRQLIEMGAMCEDAITQATQVLIEDKNKKAKKVVETQELIHQKGRDIEELCKMMLIQQQPVARDMNTIASALKIIRDMERIGSQAVELAGIAKDIDTDDLICYDRLASMTMLLNEMVSGAIDSFVHRDYDKTEEVILSDDKLDADFLAVRDTLKDKIFQDGKYAHNALDILMIAKYLERIGDHAENIATWIREDIEVAERKQIP